tara:strand:- start:40 stop:1104 length:1065 start_codon:yes stop_codon:yes gene_type:complete
MAAYTTIDDPELFFQCKLYTGTGNDNLAITLDGSENMQPDMVWIKERNDTGHTLVYDAVRGVTKEIYTNLTNAESTNALTLKSFDSDGFTLGTGGGVNTNNNTHVAWCWKANGSGSSNTDGSINTIKTSANTTSGFSINTFTGTGANATVGHGLGAAPTHLIVKKTSQGANWGHGSVHIDNWTDYVVFGTGAKEDDATFWQDTAPTSTVFSIGSSGNINTSSETHVAYCFAPKQGFSKFGTYKGNGNDDGAFIYTGFKPAWVMIKEISSTGNWVIQDNKRIDNSLADANNGNMVQLYANLTNAEDNDPYIYATANGFVNLNTSSDSNASGETYFFMAFAESPLVNSNGVPTNAE